MRTGLVAGPCPRLDPRIPEPARETPLDQAPGNGRQIPRMDRRAQAIDRAREGTARRNRIAPGIERREQADPLEPAFEGTGVVLQREDREGFREADDLDHHREAVDRHDEVIGEAEQRVVRVLGGRRRCVEDVQSHTVRTFALEPRDDLGGRPAAGRHEQRASVAGDVGARLREQHLRRREIETKASGRASDHQRRDRPREVAKARLPSLGRTLDQRRIDVHERADRVERCLAPSAIT